MIEPLEELLKATRGALRGRGHEPESPELRELELEAELATLEALSCLIDLRRRRLVLRLHAERQR